MGEGRVLAGGAGAGDVASFAAKAAGGRGKGVWASLAAHLAPASADVTPEPLPVTERFTRDSLILPLHHALTHDDQDHIVGHLRDLAAGR